MKPETDLKNRLRQRGVTIKQTADFFGFGYSTLNAQLNGYAPLPQKTRGKIEELLKMAESDANLFSHLESVGQGELAAHCRKTSGYFTETDEPAKS